LLEMCFIAYNSEADVRPMRLLTIVGLVSMPWVVPRVVSFIAALLDLDDDIEACARRVIAIMSVAISCDKAHLAVCAGSGSGRGHSLHSRRQHQP
jgi:hypothetical protein